MPYKLKSKKLAYNRIYYKANRNKLLALKRKTSKKIYIRNRKKILEKGKVYRQTHQKEISLRIKKWRKQNPHKVKTYWQKSVKKYRICHPERVQSTQKKSYIKNKIKRLLYTKERRAKYPWLATLIGIRYRVKSLIPINKKSYLDKGIKNYLTEAQIKYLWDRDKAYTMDKPTIHRKDNDGDYTVRNCEYIEHSKHIGLHNKERGIK